MSELSLSDLLSIWASHYSTVLCLLLLLVLLVLKHSMLLLLLLPLSLLLNHLLLVEQIRVLKHSRVLWKHCWRWSQVCHGMRIRIRSARRSYSSSGWHTTDHRTSLRYLRSSMHARYHSLCLSAHVRLSLRHHMSMR